MTIQLINIGVLPNDGTGDPLRVAFEKINNNFSNLSATSSAAPPDGAIQFRDTNALRSSGVLNVSGTPTYVVMGYPGRYYTSTDSINWTEVASPATATSVINQIYTNTTTNQLIAVGSGGIILVASVVNSVITWSPATSGTTNDLYGISFDGTTYVAVGQNGTLLTATNPIGPWTAQTVTPTAVSTTLYSAASVSITSAGVTTIVWFAVGAGGVIITSTNGTTWTNSVSPTGQDLYAITTNGATTPTFVAVGAGGTVVTNVAVAGWNLITGTAVTTNNLRSITFGTGTYVAVGDNGTIISSIAPVTWAGWAQQTSGTNYTFFSVEYLNSNWLAVGNNGAIFYGTTFTAWTSSSIQGTVLGSANLVYDTINSNLLIAANIIPTSNSVSIGSQASPVKDLWLAGNSLHVGNITESQTSANTLTFSLDSNVSNLANIVVGGLSSNGVTANNVTGGNAVFGNLTVTGNSNTGGLRIGNVALAANATYLQLDLLDAANTSNFASIGALTANITNINASNIVTANSILGNATANTVTATSVTSNLVTTGNINVTANANINVINANTGNITTVNANLVASNVITATGNITGANLITAGNVTSNNVIANANITATGNIQGAYILGNGYFLTGTNKAAGPANSIQFAIPDGTGNFTFGSDSTFTYNDATNTLSVSNAVATNLTATTAAITTVSAGNVTATGNVNAANVNATAVTSTTLTGSLTTNAQPNITSVGPLNSLAVNGTISGFTAGFTGTVSAPTFIGDLTGRASFANVANTVSQNSQPNITSVGTLTSLSVSGTIFAPAASITTVTGNLVGDSNGLHRGSVIGDVTGNVSGTTLTASGTVTANTVVSNNITITGNVAAQNGTFTSLVSQTFSGTLVGNSSGIHTGQVVGNVNGNITGATGVFTGDVSAGNVTTGNINVTANITAGNVTGANLVSANYLHGILDATSSSQPNITFVGNLTQANINGNLYVGGQSNTQTLIVRAGAQVGTDLTVGGNLNVTGNVTYTNANNLYIQDPIIEEGGGANGAPLTNNDGQDRGLLSHYYTTQPVDAFFGWKNANGEYIVASNANIANNVITVNQLANLRAGNFIGNISGGNGTFTGNVSAGNITFSGNITGNGNNLSNLRVQDYLAAGNNITLTTAAGVTTIAANLTTAAAGNTSEIQFNANGLFAASNAFTFSTTTNTLTVTNITSTFTGNITGNVVGNVTGNVSAVTVTATGNIQGANVIATANFVGNLIGDVSANIVTSNIANANTLTINNTATVTNTLTAGNLITAGYANSGNVNTTNIVASGNANLGNIRITDSTITSVNTPLALTSAAAVSVQGNSIAGSNTNIYGGNSTSATAGGNVNISGGVSASGDNGSINILGGQSSVNGANAGVINIRGGNAVNDIGGAITITGGTATSGTGTGGNITIIAGAGSAAANGKLTLNRLVFPDTAGSAGQLLGVDGSGNITFSNANTVVAGTNQQVQFNDGGVLGANANLTFNKTSATLSVGNALIVGNNSANTTITSASATTSSSTAGQVVAQWPNTTWRSAKMTINTDDGISGNRQTMVIDLTSYGNGVDYTMTGARKIGTSWLANYAVDYNSGSSNVRLLTSPAINTTLNHVVSIEYYN